MHTNTHTHTQTHRHTQTNTHKYKHTHKHKHINTNTHKHKQTHKHINTNTHTNTNTKHTQETERELNTVHQLRCPVCHTEHWVPSCIIHSTAQHLHVLEGQLIFPVPRVGSHLHCRETQAGAMQCSAVSLIEEGTMLGVCFTFRGTREYN
jgi:hypothetical protein